MTQAATMAPPVARRDPNTVELHGERWTDDYHWLRKRENPDVIAYLEAENAYTEARMAHTRELQARLYEEMVGHIKETDESVPVQIDDFYYYSRTEEGKQYKIHCRKQGSLDAPEVIILDENALAEGHDYFRLAVYRVSPDHRLLAYSIDTAGSERYTLRVRDLATGEDLPDAIPDTSYSAEWANDSRTLFYTVLNEVHRPFRLYRHELGADPEDDALVFEEPDEMFFLGLSKTRSKAFLVLALQSKITSERHVLPADEPRAAPRLVAARQRGIEYDLAHHRHHFYIITNADGARNFKLVRTPVDKPGREQWQEVIPYNEAVKLDSVHAFERHLVLFERLGGLRAIRVLDLTADDLERSRVYRVPFDEPTYTVWPGENPNFDTRTLRFHYSSLVEPESVYDYDMASQTRVLRKRLEVPGGYNPADYQSERIFAKAQDGTEIPISLVYRKGMQRNGRNPFLLYGYGSYGFSIDPSFSSNRISLLDRGMIFAIGHIRGGGEMGRPWYEAGKWLHKKNTFTDFIACAELVIAEGYTGPDRLAITGRSAGGLLMGAVTNMRPDLFHVVVAGVPFVDVINTMLDESIPLTVIEYDEWGNPNDLDYFTYMRQYSPYDNVEAKNYPHILATAGLNDPRVQYWEPAKWIARLRRLKTDDKLLLLKTNMGAGHAGASGRYDYLKEVAFEYAFILDRLGVV